MNKTYKILIILLLALNIATISTILYNKKKQQKKDVEITFDNKKHRPIRSNYFADSLGFDTTQMKVFRKERIELKKKAKTLIYEMDSLKKEMFNEINKNEPNLLILNNLSDSIGRCHADLKKASNTFYLKIKEISNEKQKEQLQKVFYHLYKDKNIDKLNRHRHRNKLRHNNTNKKHCNNLNNNNLTTK